MNAWVEVDRRRVEDGAGVGFGAVVSVLVSDLLDLHV